MKAVQQQSSAHNSFTALTLRTPPCCGFNSCLIIFITQQMCMEPLHLGLVPCPKLEIQRIIKILFSPLRTLQSSGGDMNEQNYHEKYMRKLLNRDKETFYENSEK